nr:zinc finger protein 45 [Hymenolepis microstoma]
MEKEHLHQKGYDHQDPITSIGPENNDLNASLERERSFLSMQTDTEHQLNGNLTDISISTTPPPPLNNPESNPDDLLSISSSILVDSNSTRRYRCSECTQIFHWHGDLAEHLREAHNIIRQARNSSRTSRNGRSSLESTIPRRSSGKSTGEPFGCLYCKYEAKYESELKRHMRLHMKAKPFKCDFCEYKSSWKGDLKRHIEAHHKDKFKTSEELARIMSKFKNNAGTIPIESTLKIKREFCRASSIGSLSGDVSMSQASPPLPSTSFTGLTIPHTSFNDYSYTVSSNTSPAAPNQETGCPLPFPLPQMSDVSALLTLPTQSTSNASFQNPTVSFSSPVMSSEAPKPSSPLKADIFSPILHIMANLRNSLPLQFPAGLPPIEPLGVSIPNIMAIASHEKSAEDAQKYMAIDDQPLNLVCREGFLSGNQSLNSDTHSQTVKRRATTRPEFSERFSNAPNHRETKSKPFMCSGCGHRSNWKWDVNKHIELAHPNRTGLQIITLSEEEALRTLPEYIEKMRLYGRNGRPKDDPNSETHCREGYARRFLCPACGHRSNWRWDVKKHMTNIHGREYSVYELSVDLALRTLKDYLERKKRGQPVVVQDSEELSNVPSTSAQAYASDNSPEGCSPENNRITESIGDNQSIRDEDVGNGSSSSITPCPICRAVFPCVEPLSVHMGIIHQCTLESAGISLPSVSPSNSMPLEFQTELGRENISPHSSIPLRPIEDQVLSATIPVGSKRAFPESQPEEVLRLTPDSTTSSGSFIPINRPRIRARRSQLASSATQTQSSAPLTTLDNMIPIEQSNPGDASVCQLADLLKQTTDFLSALLRAPNLDSQPENDPSHTDENSPSSSLDRTEHLASLLMHPQVQRLTDQLLPLLQRVKERVENADDRRLDAQAGQ